MSHHSDNDGYPDSIQVDHARMKILVQADYISEAQMKELGEVKTVQLKDKYGYEEDFIELPAKFVVCGNCDGKGSHVDRAIDGNGLPSEFEEDPDFMEDYMAGSYDVTCDACHGNRVVLQPATELGEKIVWDICKAESDYRAEVAAERRMGC